MAYTTRHEALERVIRDASKKIRQLELRAERDESLFIQAVELLAQCGGEFTDDRRMLIRAIRKRLETRAVS